MLEVLTIQGVVLVDKLELKFSPGFTVLTGETGAGKSILLDALGLALGERANTQLLNPRHTSAVVTAVFSLRLEHPIRDFLQEQGLVGSQEESVILRRVVTEDGKSRAYINDQSVSLGLLKEVGSRLVEIHGQFDHLLDARSHLSALDRFAHLESQKDHVKASFARLTETHNQLKQAEERQSQARADQEFLTYAIQEIRMLSVQEKEEETLKTEREFLLNHSRIVEYLQTIYHKLYAEKGADNLLRDAQKAASKVQELVADRFGDILAGLERAATEIEELQSSITQLLEQDQNESRSLDAVEERLFNLRAMARKHGVATTELPLLLERFEEELKFASSQDEQLSLLRKQVEKAREEFIQCALVLRQQRYQASQQLEQAIHRELVPLKLGQAEVKVEIEELGEGQWSETGMERVEFKIQPNPGMPLGSFSKIASGGERSRFMLALKVILANTPDMSLLIFDEIDAGVGGSVAAAIGERMSRLGAELQVLAITHAPQVAARASDHWIVTKKTIEGLTSTDVYCLAENERIEEIARMLAGEAVTPEARAAALQLLNQSSGIAA